MSLLWSLILLFLPLFSCAPTSFPSPSTLSTALSSTKINQRSESLQSIAKSIVSLYSTSDAFNLWDTSKSHVTTIELEKQPTFVEIGCPTLFFGQALQAAGIRRANINAGSTQFCSQFISDESYHGFPKSDIVLAPSLLWHDISYLTHQWVVRALVKHAPSLVIFGTGIDHVALSQHILSKQHGNINDYGIEAWNIEGWIERFAAFGYALDTLSTAVLRQHISCTKFDDPALASIFHSSILVFRITSAHPSIKTHNERIATIAPHVLHTLSARDQYRMIIDSIHTKTCRTSVTKQRTKFEAQVDKDKSLDVEMRGEIISLAMNLWQQQQQQWNRIWTSIQQDALTHMLRTSDMTTSRAPISSISASLVHPYASHLPGFSMSEHDTRLSPLPDPRELMSLFEVKPNEKTPRWSQWNSDEQRSLLISLLQSRRFATLTLLLTSICNYYIKVVDTTTKFDTIPLLDDTNDVIHHEINHFIDIYYSLLLRPDMILSYDDSVELIYNIPAITRLVRISDVDIDQYYENIETQHIPIRNILATYIPNLSPTQHEWISIKDMMSRDSQLTSLWFIMIMSQTSDGVHIDADVIAFVTRAVETLPHDTYIQEWLYETHWGSVAVKAHTEMASYVSEGVSTLFPATSLESTYKNITNAIYAKHLSQEIQSWNKTFPVSPLSSRGLPRIAVMVPHFTISSPSIRRSFPILTHLRTLFDITLILYTPDAISNDRIIKNQIWAFREWGDVTIHNILKLEESTTIPRINWIVKQNFAAIIYIDLSHRLCSFLASHRLARIQIALGYPSPQSSYGTLIDYWIGGGDVEKIDEEDTVDVKLEGKMVTRLKSYWETLVLVPGTGILLSPPTAFPRDLLSIRVSARPHDTPDKPFILNCPWSLSSFDLHHIARLISIRDSVSRSIKFRFFIGERDGKRLSILRILRENLGTKYVELIPIADGIEFTRYLSQGHLMLDSYPHGSLLNLVTTLCTRVGVVSLEGDQWSNRIGPAILRKMDLESLVATTSDDFVSRVVNLINDADTYNNMMSALLKTNLSQRILIHDEERPYYGTAIKHILKQHDTWKREGKAIVKLDRSTLKRLEKANKDEL